MVQTSMRKRIAILILLVSGSLVALARNDSLEFVYDCFIQRFADENPAWKTDITLRADLNSPPMPPWRCITTTSSVTTLTAPSTGPNSTATSVLL
jgi:hypothetical protein